MRVLCDHEMRRATRERMFDARRSIEGARNKISGEYYFCIQQMLIILALGR